MNRHWSYFVIAVIVVACTSEPNCFAAKPIPRVLPPAGVELPPGKKAEITDELAALQKRIAQVPAHSQLADIEIFAKAVDFANRFGEFYNEKDIQKDVAKALAAIKTANERLDQLANGKTPWTEQRGTVVRGYRSAIDSSAQPYGMVIPAKLDLTQPSPLYVWLHGRGDKQTDLHFIHERQTSPGQIAPSNALVLHAFGRQCLGFKFAGEVDIFEAIAHAKTQYNIDPDRIVLMGFSMGGAGAWHIGAHYADRWVAVSPGAGFAETAQYQNIKPEDNTPWYEQTLWGCYDVPDYTRNLFNVPLFAYSGEKDKQIQAARIMEAAYIEHGRKLRHLIGPNTEHKYHPETLKELLGLLDETVAKGLDRKSKQISLQTRTLRYNRVHWVEATALTEHWKDSRIDAEITGADTLKVTTKNVDSMRLHPPLASASLTVNIDGQAMAIAAAARSATGALEFSRRDGQWTPSLEANVPKALAKRHGLQGPIDDAFMEPFLVVVPTGKSRHPQVKAWVDAELSHFQDRWRSVFRGDLRMKRDTEVTPEDIAQYHLILWGDPDSNQLVRKVHGQLPLNWPNGSVQVEDQRFPAESHVPVLIYPNPLNVEKYVVLNSGPTFREVHDRTNSQQNPKLPDWAILDLSQEPNATTAGRVVLAGFFDERWQMKGGK